MQATKRDGNGLPVISIYGYVGGRRKQQSETEMGHLLAVSIYGYVGGRQS